MVADEGVAFAMAAEAVNPPPSVSLLGRIAAGRFSARLFDRLNIISSDAGRGPVSAATFEGDARRREHDASARFHSEAVRTIRRHEPAGMTRSNAAIDAGDGHWLHPFA